ncbi:unnamed protein product [Penicillium nalgiovense]|nr:unnamed protein product [Penicillium nalgiovense]
MWLRGRRGAEERAEVKLFCCRGPRISDLIFFLKRISIDWILLKQSRKGVCMQCLGQQNQFALLGEAFGVKAVGRRGGGVLPDLGLGIYERCIREVCQSPEKSVESVLG